MSWIIKPRTEEEKITRWVWVAFCLMMIGILVYLGFVAVSQVSAAEVSDHKTAGGDYVFTTGVAPSTFYFSCDTALSASDLGYAIWDSEGSISTYPHGQNNAYGGVTEYADGVYTFTQSTTYTVKALLIFDASLSAFPHDSEINCGSSIEFSGTPFSLLPSEFDYYFTSSGLGTTYGSPSVITSTSTMWEIRNSNGSTVGYDRWLKIPVNVDVPTTTYLQVGVKLSPYNALGEIQADYAKIYWSLDLTKQYTAGTHTVYVYIPYSDLRIGSEFRVLGWAYKFSGDAFSSFTTQFGVDDRYFIIPKSTDLSIISDFNPFTGELNVATSTIGVEEGDPYYVDCSAYSGSSLFSDSALDAITCYVEKGLGRVAHFLLVPADSMQTFFNNGLNNFKGVFPFKLIFGLNDIALNATATSTALSAPSSTLALSIGGNDLSISLLSPTLLEDLVGSGFKTQFFGWVTMLMWIGVGILMYKRIF